MKKFECKANNKANDVMFSYYLTGSYGFDFVKSMEQITSYQFPEKSK